MPENIYGILLVSFSQHSHQRNFVPLYQAHPRIRIVAVSDDENISPDLKKLNQKWARDLDVPYIEGVDHALELKGVDIVSIGHEIERRADLSLRAAAAGKHLWIDKFIGATIEECNTVVAGIDAAGVKSIVANYTYGELMCQSQVIINSGDLGELLGLHVDIMFGKGWPVFIKEEDRNLNFLPPGQWKFPDIKRELLAVGAYAVGLVQSCVDRIVYVHGQGDAYFFPEHASRGTEDFGILTMTDSAGRIATISGGRIGVAMHPYGGPSRAYLIGTKGSAIVDGKGPMLDAFVREEITTVNYLPSKKDPMQWAESPPTLGVPLASDSTGLWRGLEDLVKALDEDKLPAYTVREARDLMEVLVAGYRSILEGETIYLDSRNGV